MTASILAFGFLTLFATHGATTTSHGPVPQPVKKSPQAAPVHAPKEDVSTKDDSPLDTDTYGTGPETETNRPTKPPATDSSVSRWEMARPYFVPAILALNALFTAMLFAAFIFLKRGMQQPLRDLKRQIERLEPKGDPMALVRADLSKLQRSVDDLRQNAASQSRFEMPRASLVAPSREVVPEESYSMRREAPRFPVLVSDYLSQRASRSLRVKATPLDAELFARDHNGEFFLVDDPDGGLYLVPAHDNITTQFFKTYYRSSYDCNAQGSGDLYLVQPAQVSAKGDLWRLTSKGKLEVRAS